MNVCIMGVKWTCANSGVEGTGGGERQGWVAGAGVVGGSTQEEGCRKSTERGGVRLG
jgi:hypothetical protein